MVFFATKIKMISISNLFFNIIYKNFAISNNNNNNVGNNNNNDKNNDNEKAKLNKITVIMKSLQEIVKIIKGRSQVSSCLYSSLHLYTFIWSNIFLINILGKKQKPKKKS